MKFKVGDRVRQVGDAHWRGMTGVYAGIQQDNFGYDWEYFTPDADATFADGSSHSYAGELCGMNVGSFELVEPTPPIPAPIPTPIAERMRGLIERIGQGSNKYWQHEAEARAIMAELAPVDGDLLEARRIAMEETADQDWKKQIIDGVCDGNPRVAIALAAIRKGRELEREGQK